MRILIPVDEDRGIDSRLSGHFGHCPFFAIFDTEADKLDLVRNEIDHSDPSLTPVDQIMKHRPDAIFSLGMGQRAIGLFREKGIQLKTGDLKTVKEVIDKLGKLEDLESGCGH